MTNKQLSDLLKLLKKHRVVVYKNGRLEIQFQETEKKDPTIAAISEPLPMEEDDD